MYQIQLTKENASTVRRFLLEHPNSLLSLIRILRKGNGFYFMRHKFENLSDLLDFLDADIFYLPDKTVLIPKSDIRGLSGRQLIWAIRHKSIYYTKNGKIFKKLSDGEYMVWLSPRAFYEDSEDDYSVITADNVEDVKEIFK